MMGLDFLQRIPLHGPCGVVHDVGCGSGELTRALYAKFHPKSLEALASRETDIQSALESDGSTSGICWKCRDARKWKPPEGSVDLVFSHLVVHWLGKAEHIDFLKLATAALKPGGIIAFAAPVLARTRILRALLETAQR
jgi:trans-aconitate methyltransferase